MAGGPSYREAKGGDWTLAEYRQLQRLPDAPKRIALGNTADIAFLNRRSSRPKIAQPPCHPERSRSISKANRLAESKHPYSTEKLRVVFAFGWRSGSPLR
jgi:hypothetical protein